MTDERFIEGVDPYDAWDREAARIEAHLATLADDDPAWEQQSRCEAWTVRDVLAHLRATEEYFAACIAFTVSDFLAEVGSRGATDLESFNAVGIADQAGKPPSQLLSEWSAMDATARQGFRERDGGDVDTSVGPYSARWQAFHLASELATHADDMLIPETDADRPWRTAWRAPFSRFALTETKPDLTVEDPADGRTRVHGSGVDLEVDDETLVAAVAGRIDDPTLAPLSTAV
ncbi:MAG TPA: maleylpyruvate isomerase family mycothiol-dependent enzyme [Acidimicrobiales bacterium]|nr:maleylpyruvate isomerase family mycothiol-dependent enzyme [Acidimicrobiales bacterium]